MKKILIIFIIFFAASGAFQLYAQHWKPYVIQDTIPIKSGTKKAKLYRLASKWLQEERGTKLVAKNRKQRKLIGRGYFIYRNRVKLPGVFLSPRANERTKGTIMFQISIHIQDSIIVVKHSRFHHEAAFSEYGTMTFGLLMSYSKVPPGKCMEIEEWCNAVWFDMKKQSELEIKWRLKKMIPALLVRKRSFRIREENTGTDSVVVVDPNAYLEFDKYIIHDKKEEPKPPPPEEKPEEKVNNKEADESESEDDDGYDAYDDDDEEEEVSKKKKKNKEDEDDAPAEMLIGDQSKKAKKKAEKQQKEKDKEIEEESDDEDEDYYDDEEPVKEKKLKKEKAPKSKKSKKKKIEEDDDYDDYDDYDDE